MNNLNLFECGKLWGKIKISRIVALGLVVMLIAGAVPGRIGLWRVFGDYHYTSGEGYQYPALGLDAYYAPHKVVPMSGFTTTPMISAGGAHTLALRYDGTVWAWGSNGFYGLLGIDSFAGSYRTPQHVDTLSNIVAVSAGDIHSLALDSNGNVWAWGSNAHGRLGLGSAKDLYQAPQQITSLSDVVAIAAGRYHSLALDASGTVWAWGNNNRNQLGFRGIPNAPQHVTAVNNIVAISAGHEHSLALDNRGAVWIWGRSGEGTAWARDYIPRRATIHNNIIMTQSGGFHSLGIDSDRAVWAWGSNRAGQLGIGGGSNTNLPAQLVDNLRGIVAIAAGSEHTLALGYNGDVWAWGQALSGRLGIGSTSGIYNTPQLVESLSNIASISAGGAHSFAIAGNGYVWAWGWNGPDGLLGIGSTNPVYSTPRRVRGYDTWYLNLNPPPPPIIWGDVNRDGQVTAADVGLLRAYLAGFPVDICREAADVNNDGQITAADVGLIRAYLAGFPVTLGPER